MERDDDFSPGDRNSGNGPLPGQQEASAAVFEDGQIRDTTAPVRPEKDGESYVYGDSRPDEIEPKSDFVNIGDSPMMTTTRESFPEVHTLSPEELKATSHGQDDEIRPVYNKMDDTESQVVVQKETAQ